jgi:DeoR/GlpR family transcriptional regulator of sugar metabolism
MDHTKVGAADFAKVCDLDAVATVVTDEPNKHLADLCSGAGVELVVAASAPGHRTPPQRALAP